MTGAAPSFDPNETVKLTAPPATVAAVAGAVTVGVGGLGWVPLIGVAQILLT